MARSREFFRRSGPGHAPRRLTTWAGGPGGNDLPTLDIQEVSGNVTVILGVGVGPIIPNLTIVRIHGFIELSLTAANVAKSGFNWAAGIGIVTNDAFTDVGASAMPDPFNDISWPGWMWHAQGAIRTAQGALAVGDPTENPVLIPIETKSMRKLRLDEILALIMQVGETGTATMDIRSTTRILAKLP